MGSDLESVVKIVDSRNPERKFTGILKIFFTNFVSFI